MVTAVYSLTVNQDKRVGATDDIEVVTLDRRKVEFLYSDNDGHWVMDLETYDQQPIPKDVFGNEIRTRGNGKVVDLMLANRLDGNYPIPIDFWVGKFT